MKTFARIVIMAALLSATAVSSAQNPPAAGGGASRRGAESDSMRPDTQADAVRFPDGPADMPMATDGGAGMEPEGNTEMGYGAGMGDYADNSRLSYNAGSSRNRQRVLLIPASQVNTEKLAAVGEDMKIMSHIFDKSLQKSLQGVYRIGGLFADFGDFFNQDRGGTEAVYLEGYGALFLIATDFPLAPPPGQQATPVEGDEPVDATWEQAKHDIWHPTRRREGSSLSLQATYDTTKAEDLKRDLINAMKHASNIRNMQPNEWIIITLTGASVEHGITYNPSDLYSIGRYSAVAGRGTPRGYGGGGYGGGGYGGGYSLPDAPAGGAAEDYGLPGAAPATRGRRGSRSPRRPGASIPSPSVMTIRAQKSEIDAFASGKLDPDQFRQKVHILMY